jgi:acyl carrier protein
MDRVRSELQDVFRRVFHDDELEVNDETTSTDVDGWDSIAQINLIIAIEKHFSIRFAASELGAMQKDGQNVGNLVELLVKKIDPGGAPA